MTSPDKHMLAVPESIATRLLKWERMREGMAKKGYWISVYRSVSNPEALTEYGKLAAPAITQAGGRLLVRAEAAVAYEAGIKQRVVVIEFDSVEKAIAAHDSDAYQAALKHIDGAAERDLRIVEGVE
jgi:uncharacterized protein (DUF1330 family)